MGGHVVINGNKSSSILESLIASSIFMSPNLIYILFPQLKNFYSLFLVYNWMMVFLILTVLSYYKYGQADLIPKKQKLDKLVKKAKTI